MEDPALVPVMEVPSFLPEEEEVESDEEEENKGDEVDANKTVKKKAVKKFTICPEEDGIESDDEIDFDGAAWDDLHQDETGVVVPKPDLSIPPPGFTLVTETPEKVSFSSLNRRKIIWMSDHTSEGISGWLLGEVVGGPSSPRSAAQGATMRVKFTAKGNKNNLHPMQMVPDSLSMLKTGLEVSLNAENYSVVWYLLAT